MSERNERLEGQSTDLFDALSKGAGEPSSTSDLYSLWRVQESLLQSYRGMFIGIESILISIGSLLAAQETLKVVLLLVISVLGLSTLIIWLRICSKRGRVVYLVQLFVLFAERGAEIREPFDKLKGFHGNQAYQLLFESEEFTKINDGGTRKMMETWFPLLFLAAWTVIWFFVWDSREGSLDILCMLYSSQG
jgi:hypothetical protein